MVIINIINVSSLFVINVIFSPAGDSVSSPLLAVFSGLMYKDGYSVRRIPEIVAQSGSALLHFYSDVAYNMTGFNISYR